jgi:hypothetical protein
MKSLRCASLCLLVLGCQAAPFDERFSDLQSGQTRAEVSAQLGAPQKMRDIKVPAPGFGAQQGLRSVLAEGDPCEEWLYEVGDTNYLVWFSTTDGKPRSQWVVVLKASYPADAVF